MSLIDDLKNRGLFNDCTKGTEEHIQERRGIYMGLDLTAPTLHPGYLIQFATLKLAAKAGHKVNVLFGVATTRIGDPTGRDTSRPVISGNQIYRNLNEIKMVVEVLLPEAHWLQNNTFYQDLRWVDWITQVGENTSVKELLNKKTFQIRDDATFSELCYPLMQAWDFCKLNQQIGITVQTGGSDQWGNITAGIKLCDNQLFGLTTNLLTDDLGNKIGKSQVHMPLAHQVGDILEFGVENLDMDKIRSIARGR